MDEASDVVAERQALAIVLAAPDEARPAFLGAPPDVWMDWRHAEVARALRTFYDHGWPIEHRSVLKAMSESIEPHRMELIGRTLVDLSLDAPPLASLPLYLDRVRSLGALREAHMAATRFRQRLEHIVRSRDELDYAEALADLRQATDDAESAFSATAPTPPMSLADLLEMEEHHDWLVPGLLERTDRLVLTGHEGRGKALAVDTPIPTPDGWSTMGALLPGDFVYGPDGCPARVVATTADMHDRPCYRLTFSDGAELVADENHRWLTETLRARETAAKFATRPAGLQARGTDQRHKRVHWPAVVTTGHIRDTLKARGVVNNHSIAATAPIDRPPADLPIAPYTLGVWLGDGSTNDGGLTLNRADSGHVTECIERDGQSWHYVPSGEHENCVSVRVDGLYRALRRAGFLGNKHIPTRYLRASATQRWALLAGLLDTDGHIDSTAAGQGRGHGAALCELTLTNKTLAADALELVLSLGIKATSHESDAKIDGRIVGRRWRITFQSPQCPFTLPRHVARWEPLRTRRAQLRYITAVEQVESVPVRCIQVDRADGLFLAGREFIPTHNSEIVAQFATTIAAGLHPFTGDPLPERDGGYRVLVVDAENSQGQCVRRYRRIAGLVDELRRRHGLPGADWKTFRHRMLLRPEGVELTNPRELSRIDKAVELSSPDVLVIGPLYKLTDTDVTDAQGAKTLVSTLDRLRVRHRCAVISEAHAGYASTPGGGSRGVRPFGSSIFLRWPEFGYGLQSSEGYEHDEHPKLVDLVAWRGAREERNWPSRLCRDSGVLPWYPDNPSYFDTEMDLQRKLREGEK